VIKTIVEVITIWLLYSLLCAFFLSLSDFFTKKYAHHANDAALAFSRIFFGLPLLWAIVFMEGVPEIDPGILLVFAAALPLEFAATLLYMKSLRVSPLSLTVPFLSFTPAFLLITSPLIMGEVPSWQGMAGVIIIVAGAYILNMGSVKGGLLMPLRMIFREKGSWMMLIVALIYSITSNLGKKGILSSNPSFFAASYFTLLSLVLYLPLMRSGGIKIVFKKELLVIGTLSALMISFHMIALKLVYVSYMISVKRSSMLFSIILGALFFKEKDFSKKIAGGMIMLAGIAAIVFFG
jgi:drug/metabolite transporter (DMT)-like permease